LLLLPVNLNLQGNRILLGTGVRLTTILGVC
jgi:hypothetical protein